MAQNAMMKIDFPYDLTIRFPGDLEYIPSIRKFVSEVLQVSDFSPKFAYRSEIIVDEICNNAVNYGCVESDAEVELVCHIFDNRVEFVVRDQGGRKEDIKRLQAAMHAKRKHDDKNNLGIEIVRMLSEKIDFKIDDNNLTAVHIIRNRETAD